MEKFLEEFVQRATQLGHHLQSWRHVHRHQAKACAAARMPSLWYERVPKHQTSHRGMPSFRRCKKCNQHEVRAEQRLVAAAAEGIFKVWVGHFRCPQISRASWRATSGHQQFGYRDHARSKNQPWTSWMQAERHVPRWVSILAKAAWNQHQDLIQTCDRLFHVKKN